MIAAIDFGLTNTDIAYAPAAGEAPRTIFITSEHKVDGHAFAHALRATGHSPADFTRVAITGGQHRRLPDAIGVADVIKVNEVEAIGRGGLALSNLEEALVVSAGSGTACVAARRGAFAHSTGSAVGGGTFVGLAKLLLGVADPQAIDALAKAGDANAVDTTLIEAVGGQIGKLPADANAVNFGKIERMGAQPRREDIAAGLARMIGQTIAVIAINAARAEGLDKVVFIGRLMELGSVRQTILDVARFYAMTDRFVLPPKPGFGTVIGAFSML
jgi:type II pantothenate kinase